MERRERKIVLPPFHNMVSLGFPRFDFSVAGAKKHTIKNFFRYTNSLLPSQSFRLVEFMIKLKWEEGTSGRKVSNFYLNTASDKA